MKKKILIIITIFLLVLIIGITMYKMLGISNKYTETGDYRIQKVSKFRNTYTLKNTWKLEYSNLSGNITKCCF